MINSKALYFRRRIFGAFRSLHQLCSSLHSLFIEQKSLENSLVVNIK